MIEKFILISTAGDINVVAIKDCN